MFRSPTNIGRAADRMWLPSFTHSGFKPSFALHYRKSVMFGSFRAR
jgi:hypothetical protein